MKILKLITIALLLSAPTIGMSKSLVLSLSNGQLAYFLINGTNDPTMKFVDGSIVVGNEAYQFLDIKSFYISETDDPNGIISIEHKDIPIFRGNMLLVANNTPHQILIYNMNGTLVDADIVSAGEYTGVDLSTIAQGTYVAKIGDQQLKFVKK